MSKSKVLILLPDGVSLKNFAYSNFYKKAIKSDLEVCFWNATPFNLKQLGYNEIQLPIPKLHRLTDVYKVTRKHIELNIYKKKFSNLAYSTYKFPFKYKTPKNIIKSLLCKLLIFFNSSESGLFKIRNRIIDFERKTPYYKACCQDLKKQKPAIVFSTNQRPVIAIAPIIAAKDLGIPTATFIFSWDNLPKATMVIETDYYFVWSDYMKEEILKYYPYVNEQNVYVTGTPQFETIFDNNQLCKKEFYKKYNLKLSKKYLCYSGDDITTSPDDPQYLEDVAQSISELNEKGYNLGLLFRKSPVDFSKRYDSILKKYNKIITPIEPMWDKMYDNWNTILPKAEDLQLLKQTILYSEMVINLGSTMVFDYAIENKPCAYINYDVNKKKIKSWSVKKIYNYLHFESMPTNNCVIWLNNKREIVNKIENAISNYKTNVEAALNWFKIINKHPVNNASSNIIIALKDIIEK